MNPSTKYTLNESLHRVMNQSITQLIVGSSNWLISQISNQCIKVCIVYSMVQSIHQWPIDDLINQLFTETINQSTR